MADVYSCPKCGAALREHDPSGDFSLGGHIALQLIGWPVFVALASFGYLLNLFNLTPVGMLDGGRIVSALSRWLWLPGFAVLLWFGWKYPNFVVWLMIILSVPRVISLFRKRTEEERRYYEVAPAQRWTMSILYFGLIITLILGMGLAERDLHRQGVPTHSHERNTVIQ